MGQAAKGFSSSAALLLPRMLGRRVLLKLVARGGMGDVYLAASTGIEGAERPCIVKTVRRDHVHDGSFLARFLDEARVQAQLQHPGVAQVLEATIDDNGEPYTVVEYVEGRSLSDLRQRTIQTGVRLAWADAVAIAIEIAQALAHVHERSSADGTPLGIVHRDLSPQNVMVGYAGEIKLIDFGTARGHNRRCHTVAGVVFAKPGYVAPEVARQQVGDGRIDIYALGIVLWELCAGRRFLTTDPRQHLDDAARGRIVVPPLAAACKAPTALDEVIALLTKNDPDERYARASLAVTGLAKLLSSAPAGDGGERGVRARIALVMRKLWPHDPARSRAEFARLLREGREALETTGGNETPPAGPVSAEIAVRMATADPRQLAGTPYRLVRRIGDGANGVVYEAEHVELGRRVALKVLASEHSGAPASLERFRREARAVACLSHPHLVSLYDFGRSLDGRAFLAMELCSGETLDACLQRGPLPWQEATRIAIETARALEAAHAAGIVHRDIKPQNLMLTRDGGEGIGGPTKLLDFGVATALTPARRTATDAEKALGGFAVVGTPEYMAPEQVAGDPVDRRTDIYALGCVMYEMLTGVRAFEGTSTVAVMGMQIRDTPLPPRARAPSQPIPRAIEAAVVRAMAKRPERRFPSATAMRGALEHALRAPDRRRERIRCGAAALLCVAALVGAASAALSWKRLPSGAAERTSGEVPSAELSTRPFAATPSLSSSTANAGNVIFDPPPPAPSFHATDTRADTIRADVGISAEWRRKLGRWAKPDVSRSGKLNSP
jgi:eukaryotic-like serine/threonine-protein kinase